MHVKCILGFHKYSKYLGPENAGNGRFKQHYKCVTCGKIKEQIK